MSCVIVVLYVCMQITNKEEESWNILKTLSLYYLFTVIAKATVIYNPGIYKVTVTQFSQATDHIVIVTVFQYSQHFWAT